MCKKKRNYFNRVSDLSPQSIKNNNSNRLQNYTENDLNDLDLSEVSAIFDEIKSKFLNSLQSKTLTSAPLDSTHISGDLELNNFSKKMNNKSINEIKNKTIDSFLQDMDVDEKKNEENKLNIMIDLLVRKKLEILKDFVSTPDNVNKLKEIDEFINDCTNKILKMKLDMAMDDHNKEKKKESIKVENKTVKNLEKENCKLNILNDVNENSDKGSTKTLHKVQNDESNIINILDSEVECYVPPLVPTQIQQDEVQQFPPNNEYFENLNTTGNNIPEFVHQNMFSHCTTNPFYQNSQKVNDYNLFTNYHAQNLFNNSAMYPTPSSINNSRLQTNPFLCTRYEWNNLQRFNPPFNSNFVSFPFPNNIPKNNFSHPRTFNNLPPMLNQLNYNNFVQNPFHYSGMFNTQNYTRPRYFF